MSTISLDPKSATPRGQRTPEADTVAGTAVRESPLHGLSGPGVDPGMGESPEATFRQIRDSFGRNSFLVNHPAAQIGESEVRVQVIQREHSTAA
jgi:hypothetical protein